MKRSTAVAMVALAVLLGNARLARADMANGSYTTDFTGVVPLWDISGDYSGDAALGLDMDFSITQSPSGAFNGSGTFNYDDGSGNSLSGDITVSGQVKNSNTAPGISMTIEISGSGTVVVDQQGDTDDVNFDALAKISYGLDSTNGNLVSTGGSVTVHETDLDTGKKESRSGRLGKGSEMALPDTSTGGWNVALDLTPNGTKYTGTATVTTSTGNTADLTATGTYSSKTDSSRITLKGAGGALVLAVTTSGPTMTIQSMKGKLYGQSVNYKAP